MAMAMAMTTWHHGIMAMASWQWQHSNGNMAMVTWPSKHCNGNILQCCYCQFTIAVYPSPCCHYHGAISMLTLPYYHCHIADDNGNMAMVTLRWQDILMVPLSCCHCHISFVAFPLPCCLFPLPWYHCHVDGNGNMARQATASCSVTMLWIASRLTLPNNSPLAALTAFGENARPSATRQVLSIREATASLAKTWLMLGTRQWTAVTVGALRGRALKNALLGAARAATTSLTVTAWPGTVHWHLQCQLQHWNGSDKMAKATWHMATCQYGNILTLQSNAMATKQWQHGNVNMAMATWQWQHGKSNMAKASWQWIHGKDNMAQCNHSIKHKI